MLNYRTHTKPPWAEWGGVPPTGPIEPWRINLLLAAKPPPIRARWAEVSDFIWTLRKAEPHALPDQAARLRLHRETYDRRRQEAERAAGRRAYAASEADWAGALQCRTRVPEVRGLTAAQCGKLRICFLDGKPLPPRRQHWCSDRCVEVWSKNHEWGWARHARLRIDGDKCVRCGRAAGTVLVDKCGDCGKAWEDGDRRRPCPSNSRPRIFDVGYPTTHVQYRELLTLQVNHRDPRYGRGYHKGCHHHLDQLESLCPPCHQVETNRQRIERKM